MARSANAFQTESERLGSRKGETHRGLLVRRECRARLLHRLPDRAHRPELHREPLEHLPLQRDPGMLERCLLVAKYQDRDPGPVLSD